MLYLFIDNCWSCVTNHVLFRTFWAIPVKGQVQSLDPQVARSAQDAAKELKQKLRSRTSYVGDESIRDLNSSFGNLAVSTPSANSVNRINTPLSTHSRSRPSEAEVQAAWDSYVANFPGYNSLQLNASIEYPMGIVALYVHGDENEHGRVQSDLLNYVKTKPHVLADFGLRADMITNYILARSWQDIPFWDLCAAAYGCNFCLLGYPSGVEEAQTALGGRGDSFFVFHYRGRFAALRYVLFSMVCL